MPEQISENHKDLFAHEYLPATLGTEFVLRFHRLLKGTMKYGHNTVVIDQLAQECLQGLSRLIEFGGHFSLKIIRNNFFFNNARIPVNADRFPIFKKFCLNWPVYYLNSQLLMPRRVIPLASLVVRLWLIRLPWRNLE